MIKPIIATKQPFTIRRALWIARLQGITNIIRAGKAKGKNKNLDLDEWLWQWSGAYAQWEMICDLTGKQFDTKTLDRAIWAGASVVTVDYAIGLFYPDNHIEMLGEKDGEK